MKRQRGRSRNKSHNNNNSNRNLDSNGPDGKVRGSANNIYEKYTTLARDAAAAGNRVKAENLRQHAEHYLRLVNIQEAAKQAAQAAREEADAARAARNEGAKSDNESEGGEGRNRRRYPPRVKRGRDNEASENGQAKTETPQTSDDKSSPEGLEVVTPESNSAAPESSRAETEVAAEEKPKRRRRAPSRKKSDEEAPETEAAE